MLHSWVQYTSLRHVRRAFDKASPFQHIILEKFFNEGRCKNLMYALLQEPFSEKESDLFHFFQTNDLKTTRNTRVKEFYTFFSSRDFLSVIEFVTGVRVGAVDMAGFIYGPTHYLLPHDDRLEGRKIAYILNLSEQFNENDGGHLELFESKNGHPVRVVKRILPTFNTLTLFKVSARSFHQVAEVVTNKQRLSLAGWFYE